MIRFFYSFTFLALLQISLHVQAKATTDFNATIFAVENIEQQQPALPFGELMEFTTDGCSNFVDGNIFDPYLWRDCCMQHDLKYWAGGSFAEREEADDGLFQCVADKGEPEVAVLMWKAVRVGGSPYWPTTFRWGYGWTEMRGYTPLTKTEKALVKVMAPREVSEDGGVQDRP